MESNEKAKELFEKYAFVEIAYYTSKHEVKECALIAVDEVILELKNLGLKYLIEWWQEVKLEIEKL